MKMESRADGEPYRFCNDYKALPVEKRVCLIKIARNLLKQQKEIAALLADPPVPLEGEGQKGEENGLCVKEELPSFSLPESKG